MTDYKASYTFEAATPEEAAQKVLTSLYLADIDGVNVKVEQLNGAEVFSFPLTQSVVRQLNEVRRPADVHEPAAEGEWNLPLDQENKLGDDV